MFGSSKELTKLRAVVTGLREELAEARGRLAGREDGRTAVAVQMAERCTDLTRQRDVAARGTERAVGDVRRALRIVAGHVLAVQSGSTADDSITLLIDEFAAAGLPLQAALLALQTERAESAVRVTASEAAAAVSSAPRTGPWPGPLPPHATS